MLTRETFLQIASDTCPGCQRPLGVHHAYPVTDPETLITRLTDHPPRCLTCATQIAEDQPAPQDGRPHLAIIIVIKVSSFGMPSGKIIKLHAEDPTTWRIHLFTPEVIHFLHLTTHDLAEMSRPASNDEAETWLLPTIQSMTQRLSPKSEEFREFCRQLSTLQHHIRHPQKLIVTRPSSPPAQ